jgi:hypothetical protein
MAIAGNVNFIKSLTTKDILATGYHIHFLKIAFE